MADKRAVFAIGSGHEEDLGNALLSVEFRETLGRKKAHIVHGITEGFHQSLGSFGNAVFPEHSRHLSAHFVVGIGEKRKKWEEHFRPTPRLFFFGVASGDS